MHTTYLRKVGGSVMLPVPPAFLAQLDLQPGAVVELSVKNGNLTATPQPRQRRTLAQLVAEAKKAGQYPLPESEREWVDAPAVGREII